MCGQFTYARTFKVDALILHIDANACTIVAAHRPIAGYMPAMTMSFRVQDAAELKNLTPGTRVQFDVENSLAKRIRRIETTDPDLIRPLCRSVHNYRSSRLSISSAER